MNEGMSIRVCRLFTSTEQALRTQLELVRREVQARQGEVLRVEESPRPVGAGFGATLLLRLPRTQAGKIGGGGLIPNFR